REAVGRLPVLASQQPVGDLLETGAFVVVQQRPDRDAFLDDVVPAVGQAPSPHPRYGTTRNAPRMNGWTRHQNAYVPGGRFVGVSQVSRPAVGAPLLPSCPESNSMVASASGNAIPVLRLHGNAQSVMVCQVP